MAPSEATAVARPAALKALELDPDLADAYAALGTLRLRYDLDWSGAEAALRRAVVLKPGSAESLWWYVAYLTAIGRDREAIETAKLYAKLDPLFADSYLGWTYLRTGHTDEAIAHYSKFVQTSRVPWDVANLAVAYVVKGDAVRAAAECDSIGAFDAVGTTGLCAWVYGNAGRRADAQKIIDGFKTRQRVDAHFAAIAAAGLHDREQVLYWLDRALVEHSPNIWGLRHATRLYFAFMRDDPRFRAFVARMNYPPGTFDR